MLPEECFQRLVFIWSSGLSASEAATAIAFLSWHILGFFGWIVAIGAIGTIGMMGKTKLIGCGRS